MKTRGIVVIDYDIENEAGFRGAAEEQDKLEAAIKNIVTGNKRVVFHQVDMKERRGEKTMDISQMKFRQA